MPTHRTVLVIAETNEQCHDYEQQLQLDEGVAYRILIEPNHVPVLVLSQAQQIDGILLELHSPDSGNLHLLRQLKEQMGDGCPPIVVVDGEDAAMAVQAFKHGATDYLVRDRMTADELRLTMRSAIDNAELRRELQSSQERFQTSIENMLDCFGIFSSIRDQSGQIIDFRIDYLNAAACENNRMPKAMQIGQRLCDVLPGHRESGLFEQYCQLVETGAPLIKDSLVYEDVYGEQRLVRAFDIRATKLHDGFVASWRDITDRKQLELALNQTVADLQTLVDMIPVGIAIATDPSCSDMQHNAYLRQLLGVNPGNNISKSAPAEQQPTYQVWQQGQEISTDHLPMQTAARLGVDIRDAEFEILRPDGTIQQILSYATPLRDTQNQVRGVIGAFLDITERNLVAAALQVSEQRYRELAEAMPQMVWTADATGTVNYWNQRWYEYTGLSEAESMGFAGASTVHPDERDRALEQWSQAIVRGQPLEIEYRLCRWDGVYHWFICRAIPTRTEIDQITGWIGTITNIDDLKRSEALIHQSEQQLQQQLAEIEAIYQSAPIGLNILDTDLRFVRINQQLADINGLPIAAHLGRSVRELFPDLADKLEQLLQPVLQTGEPLLNVEIQGETPANPGVKRTWLEHFLPLKQGDRVIGISTVCEEITERIQVEGALRQSEQRFRHMADNAPMMIWVTDQVGCCTYLSQSWYEFTGQTEATGLGFGWLEAVHPTDRELAKHTFLKANQHHEPFQIEYRLQRQDGTYRWAIDAAKPWFAETGEFKGYIGSVIDISDRKQAEEALRLSEERYRTLFESMTEGFCVVELLFDQHDRPYDYRFLEINPVFEQQTGLKQAQGKTARELLPNLESHWFTIYGQVALTGEPIQFESGSDVMNRWFEVSAFRTGPVESRRVAILFKDISQRKQAERERQESETRFRTLADNISQFAWMADERGEIFWYNQRWFDYTGATLEEMQGWGWQKVHHPEHLDRVIKKINRCFATGEIWEDTFPLRGHDGQYRWFLSRAIPVRDAQGRVLRWFGTNTDITDRKQVEEALQHSEERYRYLAEAIPQLVWTCNANGNCEFVNQQLCDYIGLTVEQAIAQGWLAAIHPEDRPATQEMWVDAIHHDHFYRTEYRLRRATDHSYRWHLVLGLPLKDPQGRVVKWFGTCTDIHDQKELELERDRLFQLERTAREAAERANRIKDEFLAVLSHELRSPLNPILGWSKLLQTRKLNEAKAAEALATIERNAKVQMQLIDDLLDVAKILRGKLSLTMTSVNLATVVEAAIETVRTTVTAKSISLCTKLPNIGQVSGDAARLQQIVWNLLSNAIKFTPTGGQVTIRLERRDAGDQTAQNLTPLVSPVASPPGYAYITVTDTGKGINPDFIPYLFETFRQEDASITRKYGGLGLGLAIVRQLVEAHGGTIVADSPGEGLGATFIVQLPLLNVESEVNQPDEVSPQVLDLTGMRILTVDDEPDARELLSVLLTQYGAEVLAVESA
ncbi:MAG TPA: PAS domain S-box protein, partial [Microcoleaceae cyanobacterium]